MMPAYLPLLAAAVGFCAWLATGRVTLWLRRRAILDRPNERSSHTVPTPRGGGLGLLPPLLAGWCLLAALAGGGLHWAMAGGAMLLLLVSWRDDRGGLSVGPRLAAQLAALLPAALLLPGPVAQGWLPAPLDTALAAVAWVWFVNLYNFMDGIDGISGVELGSIAFGLVLLAALGLLAPGQGLAALLLLAALLGFLAWNWHPAALFLGDVGSVPLGYLVGWLLLLACGQGLWPAALILPAYYWADATLTLLARLRRGEKVWQAHRSHFYQRALASLSHGQVAGAILLADLLLVGATLLAARGQVWAGLGLGALIVLLLLLWLARRVRPA